jgi:hypothetical protein
MTACVEDRIAKTIKRRMEYDSMLHRTFFAAAEKEELRMRREKRKKRKKRK